jgi:hypothetical protein
VTEAPREKSRAEYIADKCIAEALKARDYLSGRGISDDVIDACIKAKTIGFNSWSSPKCQRARLAMAVRRWRLLCVTG